MSFAPPTQAGFLAWVRTVMQVPTPALPDNSPSIGYAFTVAMAVANDQFNLVDPTIYTLMVYNLGGDNLINWAPDQTGSTFFADARKEFGCLKFIGGIITTASDEGTAGGIAVVESLKNLTVADLENLKTPYGRAYLGFAQRAGTLWGLS